MRTRAFWLILIGASFCLLCVVLSGAGDWLWLQVRPQPGPANQTLFEGVTYRREVRQSPRPMVIHILTVDLRAPGINILVTPGDPDEDLPLQARTTGQFLADFDLQVAVNGDGFEPWYTRGFFDYYPKRGDRVAPIGMAASQGVIYSQATDNEPVLYIARTNRARFNTPIGKIHNAISGNLMLVQQGKATS